VDGRVELGGGQEGCGYGVRHELNLLIMRLSEYAIRSILSHYGCTLIIVGAAMPRFGAKSC
jgi:hypothetical protein